MDSSKHYYAPMSEYMLWKIFVLQYLDPFFPKEYVCFLCFIHNVNHLCFLTTHGAIEFSDPNNASLKFLYDF